MPERVYIISPRHGFFAKDGRGWYAGSSGNAKSLAWPPPTTLRGALCTAIGRGLEDELGRTYERDEWLSLKARLPLKATLALRAPALETRWTLAHRMWPSPADALHLQGCETPARLLWADHLEGIEQVEPREDPARSAVAFGYLQAREKPTSGPAWWTEEEMLGWLLNDPSQAPSAQKRKEAREPYGRLDVHVKMDPSIGAAEKGALWSAEQRETLVGFKSQSQRLGEVYRWAAALILDADAPIPAESIQSVTLAGDRRLAELEQAEVALQTCPQSLLDAVEIQQPKSLRLYAVTPALFSAGWYPDAFKLEGEKLKGKGAGCLGELLLDGAMVQRSIPISGWSMQPNDQPQGARGPVGRPGDLSWAVPPGSLYRIRRSNNEPFNPEQVEQLWLSQWGQRKDDGFGCFIPGLDTEISEGGEL